MESHIGNIMTLSNSIIGVSILAMPFCFKQCGIILSILILIISSIITRLTCHFLLKSAIMARRRTFELLAFHAFGTAGKFMVELGIIGFLMGTCIAFFVIIGDLGPAIIAKIFGTKPTDILRTSILIGVAIFCVLPLGLLKNVDSLHSVSTATIGFYFCLVLKTISESTLHFLSRDWLTKVELWRPAGVLQCLPIFAMALSCQTQLFEIYETVANPTIDKMNYIVRVAINICVAVYICVGFFGYVAFAALPFTGNILMSFSQSPVTDVMKIGFVLSVAFSFPLVIFPCRASLYSLLFKKGYSPYEGASNYIPESRFKLLTVVIVATSLTIGILIPNIEVVLGLLGSTIGTMICMIFPVTCFICISTKNTNERLLAQILLFIGVIVMVLGTYANLYAMEQINDPVIVEKVPINEMKKTVIKKIASENIFQPDPGDIKIKLPDLGTPLIIQAKVEDIRLEPPQPIEPVEEKNNLEEPRPNNKLNIPNISEINKDKPDNELKKNYDSNEKDKQVDSTKSIIETQTKKVEEVDIEAIRKEDTELQEEEKGKVKEEKESEKQKAELLKTLEKHEKEQKSLIKEQKELIQELKKEQQVLKKKQQIEINVEQEVRRKAANQILEIAKKAIEQLAPESIGNNTLLQSESKEKDQTKNTNKKSVIADPVAKKIIDIAKNINMSNKTENKNSFQNEIPIPLPLAVNKTLNDILFNKEHKLNLENIDKNIHNRELKIAESTSQLVDKNSEKNNKDENSLSVRRDILAQKENADNERVKREINDGTINLNLNTNEKCEVTEKQVSEITKSPLISLMTEISKSQLLKLESNNLIESMKSQLKVDSLPLRITKK